MSIFTDLDVKRIVKDSFEEAVKIKDYNEKFKNSNTYRSAKFVSALGERLKDFYVKNDLYYHLNVQKVDDESGRKTSGEWLLDVSLTKQKCIEDPAKKQSKAKINTEIIWAVESEYHTGLDKFAEDFGKLMCIKSQNYLYLNGVNQEEKNLQTYILRRLETVSDLLRDREDFYGKNFYYGFWVSPEIKNGKSIWDSKNIKDLIKMTRVFKYVEKDKEENTISSKIDFIEIQ
ncbi:hypothetical protein [Clostridium ganghwense]|uniref:Restriction endonuclease n=1 Tax=Clostridium ganghwense TaxID=312089 RepID=A0ABT4CKN2_9CLOT|nr:hypothetical protein [Clostridium ganghwense]MCY6369483.1 hypothetical protein [Clostridium ganghwense]